MGEGEGGNSMIPDLANPKTDVHGLFIEFYSGYKKSDQLWFSVVDIMNWLIYINVADASLRKEINDMAHILEKVWIECEIIEKINLPVIVERPGAKQPRLYLPTKWMLHRIPDGI